jgi:2-polyprenyl-3-methyl-5-hydroxy-6-metoxy-1,4-benzoquinol methylase
MTQRQRTDRLLSSAMTSHHINSNFSLAILASVGAGAALTIAGQYWLARRKPDGETDPSIGHSLVWSSIGGAMNAAMMYTGDRLKLYETLREMCAKPASSVTAIELAEATGLNQRWLREWLAQQAAMGVLKLLPGTENDDAALRYRLPKATAEVLADPDSREYDIAMIQAVPSLVNRAKTMLPEAFATGMGRPYDEADVAEAIDRNHRKHVRDVFIPLVLRPALGGSIAQHLEDGCDVADLGCGAGVMLILLAKSFPKSSFHGFEVSQVALEKAAFHVAAARVSNVFLHNATEPGESLRDQPSQFDLVVVFDVLHDSPFPDDLIQQVKTALKPSGAWLLADIPSAPTTRENLVQMPTASTYFAFSTCLCMSCSLSEEGGAGLGTLGFSVPVAEKMLREGGFKFVKVLLEKDNARWFLVH